MTEPVLKHFIDTTTPHEIDIDGSFGGCVAYADGDFAWPLAEIERFVTAKIHLYRISATGADPRKASFVDVERFDVTPAHAAAYVKARNKIWQDGGIYCDRATVPAVLEELGSVPCDLWCADWTGEPHVPALHLPPNVRLVMVQYAHLSDRDLSAAYSREWLG